MQTGEVGIRAVKPIIVDGKCIKPVKPVIVDGRCTENRGVAVLKTHSKVALCEDDMTIVVEYEVQINA